MVFSSRMEATEWYTYLFSVERVTTVDRERGGMSRNHRQKRNKEGIVYSLLITKTSKQKKPLNLGGICNIKLRGSLFFSDFLV